MKMNKAGIDLIKASESCSLKAYKDPAGEGGLPITIGWGSTMYKNGSKIKMGEKITQAQADELLAWEVDKKSTAVIGLLAPYTTSDNQFSALVSFAYNAGIGNLKSSTLLKKVRKNVSDPTIKDEFLKWVNANGKPLKGLKIRRAKEWELYNTK